MRRATGVSPEAVDRPLRSPGADTGSGSSPRPCPSPPGTAPNGCVIDAQGNEIPITEAMIEAAIRALDSEGVGLGGTPREAEALD